MNTTKNPGKSIVEMLIESGCEFKSYENEYPYDQDVYEQINKIVRKIKKVKAAKENQSE